MPRILFYFRGQKAASAQLHARLARRIGLHYPRNGPAVHVERLVAEGFHRVTRA
jgi:hypothetical protein